MTYCFDISQRNGVHHPNSFTVMAEEHPPSPNREDDSLSLWRLRVEPAMTGCGQVLCRLCKLNLHIYLNLIFDRFSYAEYCVFLAVRQSRRISLS